ncbi:hypothetical protein G7Y89_g4048 [Cudoniella acicularis]|uniref:Uncharacterized protein n=1 Tax=Cudoniella acicularis TaxID=354080 RepID=A0A8H4RS58_9HELO|nr:hypothetical protein G7Y89_g4048 [Cudoniella acicularis]
MPKYNNLVWQTGKSHTGGPRSKVLGSSSDPHGPKATLTLEDHQGASTHVGKPYSRLENLAFAVVVQCF